MALASYTDLLASVASFLHRSDITAVIPDFVTLCEANLNRDLRCSQMETSATLTVSGDTATLPADFLEVRQILTDASPPKALTYVAPDDWARYGQQAGTTRVYTIMGDRVRFAESHTAAPTLLYYAKIPALVSAVGGVNWLLTAHPDAYLYGTLQASAPFIGNDARLATWSSLYTNTLLAIRGTDKRRKLGSGLQVRPTVQIGA